MSLRSLVAILLAEREEPADPPCANPKPTGLTADRKSNNPQYPNNHDPARFCDTCSKFHYEWEFKIKYDYSWMD